MLALEDKFQLPTLAVRGNDFLRGRPYLSLNCGGNRGLPGLGAVNLPAQTNRILDINTWVWQTNVSHHGGEAAHSPPPLSGIIAAFTWVSARVTGPGTLGFWWRLTAVEDFYPARDFDLTLSLSGAKRAATSE